MLRQARYLQDYLVICSGNKFYLLKYNPLHLDNKNYYSAHLWFLSYGPRFCALRSFYPLYSLMFCAERKGIKKSDHPKAGAVRLDDPLSIKPNLDFRCDLLRRVAHLHQTSGLRFICSYLSWFWGGAVRPVPLVVFAVIVSTVAVCIVAAIHGANATPHIVGMTSGLQPAEDDSEERDADGPECRSAGEADPSS